MVNIVCIIHQLYLRYTFGILPLTGIPFQEYCLLSVRKEVLNPFLWICWKEGQVTLSGEVRAVDRK